MQIDISIDNIKFRKIFLFDNPIANKYFSLLKTLINENGLDFDNRRCFYSYKTDIEIENDLDDAVFLINKFFQKELLPTDKANQNYFNDMHQGFELLNKGYDDFTLLKAVGPPNLIESIRDVNFCTHKLEHGKTEKVFEIQWNKETTQRVALDENDYLHATHKCQMNHVYLGYNEVGKNILDLYNDDLPIDYPGLKNNHFVGPDMIFFHKEEPLFEDGFLKWCTKHSIDPFEPKNGILNYPIGTFETLCAEQNFSPQSKITAYDLIDK